MEFETIKDIPQDIELRAGVDLLRQGQLEAAAAVFNCFRARCPDEPYGHFFSGLVAYQLDKSQPALEALERAVQFAPMHASFWCMLGRALYSAQRVMLSEACLQRALTLDPGHLDALAAMGQLLSKLGRHEEAERALRAAILRSPTDARLLFRLALVLDGAGKRSEARRMYEQVLLHDPKHADTNNNLALLLHADGKLDEAHVLFERALASRPSFAEAHYNLGRLYAERQDWARAEACYSAALTARPRYFEALNNLGNLHVRMGRTDAGIECLRSVVALRPDDPVGYQNLCHALEKAGRPDDAIAFLSEHLRARPALVELRALLATYYVTVRNFTAAYRELAGLLKIRPASAEGRMGMGIVLLETGRKEQALRELEHATRLAPGSPRIWVNYASGLRALERWNDAEAALRRARTLSPDDQELERRLGVLVSERGRHDEALAILGGLLQKNQDSAVAINDYCLALRRAGRHAEAVSGLQKAVEPHADNAYLWCNLGTAQMDLAAIPAAIASFEKAMALVPTPTVARWNHSHCLLLLGRWKEGFAGYEARLDPGAPSEISCRQDALGLPLWTGEPLAGKRLVVVGEQGLGDQLQFLRFLPQVCAQAASVDLVLRPEVLPVAQGLPGVRRLLTAVPKGEYDYYVMLMSLPHMLGLERAEQLRAPLQYLSSAPERFERWRGKLKPLGAGPRVGLAWSGFARHPNDRYRSIPGMQFGVLARPDVGWCSLHKRSPGDAVPFACIDLGAEFSDLGDTAAVMRQLDLVITVDTSVAHLAGALGVPVWVLLPANPDWRWGLEGEETPWYASMRLFRQKKLGDWEPVLQLVSRELDRWLAARQRSGRSMIAQACIEIDHAVAAEV